MSYTTTSRLGLKKAVVGSNQAFETSVFNENWDAVDAEALAVDGRLDVVEAAATSLDGRLDVVEPKVTALESLTGSGQVNSALKLDGRKLTVGSTQPVSPVVGDLWIQV